jgi:type II secretion system protein J
MKAGIVRNRRGFTILEILVALVLFSLVVAAIYSSWMAIVKSTQTARRVTAAVQRSRSAMRAFETALTCARSFAGDPDHYYFTAENGEDASLSFVAKLPGSFLRNSRFGDFDVRRVTFSLRPSRDNGTELVLQQMPLLMEMDIDEQEHPVVLETHVRNFEMAFWDPRSGDWLDEWTETNQLPRMMRITLEMESDLGAAVRSDQEITRIIALPAVGVQPGWQAPGAPPRVPPQRQTIRP